jgi:hypothetical protein
MTKFTKFDRKNLNSLRAEMSALLSKFGIDSNLELAVGNMKFSEAEVEIKVTAKVIGAKTRADSVLETMIKLKGLKLKNVKGDELVGYNTRAHKMPFIYLKAADGKRYKCAEDIAKFMFAA